MLIELSQHSFNAPYPSIPFPRSGGKGCNCAPISFTCPRNGGRWREAPEGGMARVLRTCFLSQIDRRFVLISMHSTNYWGLEVNEAHRLQQCEVWISVELDVSPKGGQVLWMSWLTCCDHLGLWGRKSLSNSAELCQGLDGLEKQFLHFYMALIDFMTSPLHIPGSRSKWKPPFPRVHQGCPSWPFPSRSWSMRRLWDSRRSWQQPASGWFRCWWSAFLHVQ